MFTCLFSNVCCLSAYPKLHSSNLVQYEIVGNYSLLYTIPGTDPSLVPYLLMAHLDVVPADPLKWEAEPFGADIINDFIYGRGTIDFKHGVMVSFLYSEYVASIDKFHYDISWGFVVNYCKIFHF